MISWWLIVYHRCFWRIWSYTFFKNVFICVFIFCCHWWLIFGTLWILFRSIFKFITTWFALNLISFFLTRCKTLKSFSWILKVVQMFFFIEILFVSLLIKWKFSFVGTWVFIFMVVAEFIIWVWMEMNRVLL